MRNIFGLLGSSKREPEKLFLCNSWNSARNDISPISFLFLYHPQQNSSKITSKSCDPTLISEENISYKNPYSSFMSKATYWWMTSLLWKGFFKPLELNDLGNLAESDTSRYHYDQFLFVYQSFKVGGRRRRSKTFPSRAVVSFIC